MMRAVLVAAIVILPPAHVRAQGALLETLDDLRQVKDPPNFAPARALRRPAPR